MNQFNEKAKTPNLNQTQTALNQLDRVEQLRIKLKNRLKLH